MLGYEFDRRLTCERCKHRHSIHVEQHFNSLFNNEKIAIDCPYFKHGRFCTNKYSRDLFTGDSDIYDDCPIFHRYWSEAGI